MQLNINVPAIRFKGFNDPWEIKLVEYFLEERNEQLPKNLEYPLMAFVAYKGISNKGDRYNREFLVNDTQNKKYKRTELGDFIYSSNNLETGSIGLNNYGKACISPVYSVFKPTQFGDSSFIGNLLKQKSFVNKMVKWRQGVVYGQWKIHESNFLRISEYIPNLPEQTQIGNFFKSLDKQINLLEQKHQKLVNLKKAMLEKMFPKEGADVPEIRFNGFTEKWEEKKLGDVVEFYSGLTYSPKDVKDSKHTLVLRSSNVKNNNIVLNDNVYVDNNVINSSNVKVGDIIVVVRNGSRNLIGKHAEIKTEMPNTVIGAFMTGVRYNVSNFLNALLDSNRFTIEIEKNLGATINQITTGSFKSMLFKFPPLEEQRKIGKYFEQLDTLIQESEVQIKKLKNIKQALLQKMFV